MQRRDFLTASAACGLATAAFPRAASAQNAPSAAKKDATRFQFYEWRTYRLSKGSDPARLHGYLKDALLPTWTDHRYGDYPMGVFTEIGPDASPSVHALFVYYSAQEVMTNAMVFPMYDEYLAAAADYLAITKNEPAFDRIDSWFMVSFLGAPQIQLPNQKPCILEMRTYESFSEERGRAKIKMFNSGEIPIFQKCGFEPVFFGEALIGSGLPCLKYMLASPNMDANKASWERFKAHPDWIAMRDLPQYKDTVSKVTTLFLEPTPYSQI
jgi:hypothetical protein